MALPSSGQITLNQVNVELGLSGTAQISMNDSAVRTLFGIASGEIEMSDGYGKANEFTFTISSNTQEANLSTLASSAGWNGNAPLICNINSNIYVWSDDTSNAGLLLTGNFPNGVTVNNSGFIMGRGGNSGRGYSYAADYSDAGDAIVISSSSSVTINNNSGAYIGGGGGGGSPEAGGGGAGGGSGGANGEYNFAYGGQGGAVGQSGANGNDPYNAGRPVAYGGGAGGGGGGKDAGGQLRRGAGGGRIFPGTSGAGGGGSYPGGSGGSAGNAGSAGGYNSYWAGGGGGGGGWGASGGAGYMAFSPPTYRAPGSAGKAIEDNGSSYTLSNSGTIYGAT